MEHTLPPLTPGTLYLVAAPIGNLEDITLRALRTLKECDLVAEAGSPGISDPGERVVRAAIAAGFRVESVPGPSALVAALTASGLETEEFHFIGFLPHKSGQRRTKLEQLRN